MLQFRLFKLAIKEQKSINSLSKCKIITNKKRKKWNNCEIFELFKVNIRVNF